MKNNELLEKAVNSFSHINNTVVGHKSLGIITEGPNGYRALSLKHALAAMKDGDVAMQDAIENLSIDLPEDYEI